MRKLKSRAYNLFSLMYTASKVTFIIAHVLPFLVVHQTGWISRDCFSSLELVSG